MITYSQMNRKDKYSQHSSVIFFVNWKRNKLKSEFPIPQNCDYYKKESIFFCNTWFELYISKWSAKIVKVVKEHPPWLGANIGKFWQIRFPRCTKIEFLEVIYIKQTKQMESISAHWQRLWRRNRLWYRVHFILFSSSP